MKLSQWLEQPGNTAIGLGQSVGVSHVSVLRWASGERLPTHKNAKAVEVATGGQVTKAELRPDIWSEEVAA